jgi:KUP system potassium uptake protein
MIKENHHAHHRLSAAGLLITLGIIYGDIGTSPLYVMKAILEHDKISEEIILGGLSCIFWTLTLQTSIKYVMITLKADNNGEGGIFSLFALMRRRMPLMIWFAIIGGSTLLADGIITPPISIASAVEGLRIFNPDIPTIPIIIVILIVLFVIQSFGTQIMGRAFGPVMFIWFMMIGLVGLSQITTNLTVLKAINPSYAIDLLVNYPGGFWLLGAVFLCTTGAEALYSDLGHCGLQNIRISWMFVKSCLILNYMGQGAWLLKFAGQELGTKNPFYGIMPDWFVIYGIAIATLAAIIASQALISGSFSLISEAMKLTIWPKMKIVYPTVSKGQLYVPAINWLMLAGCIGIVLHFKESANMDAAYGLSISLTMLMTTILLYCYLTYIKKAKIGITIFILLTYLLIEGCFLIANLRKFVHGGYVTLIISGFLIFIMWVWHNAKTIKDRLTEYVRLEDYFKILRELSNDITIPKYSTHLVYLTTATNRNEIESKIIYSLLQKQPKRADIYWFVHIDVLDDPYTTKYNVEVLVPDDVVKITFKLGFRVEQRVNLFFRQVVTDMIARKEIDFTSRYASLNKHNVTGDFRFVVLEKHLSNENDLPRIEQFIMKAYFIIKKYTLSEESAFGLDTSSVTVEKVPLVIAPNQGLHLEREN